MLDFLIPIWDPFVNLMVWAILQVHDAIQQLGLPGAAGLSIIAFTLILRALTVPLYMQQLKSTKAMQQLQPEIQALQKKHGKDREKLMQEQMKLYREYKINPAAGCLPMLIQMPIWIGLYQALQHLNQLAPFQEPFLWLPSLAQHDPYYILPVLTVATQFVVTKMMMTPSADPQQQQMNQVMLFMPLMFGFFALQVPAGLVLYWVVSNLFTMAQQYVVAGPGGLKRQPAGGAAPASGGSRAESAPTESRQERSGRDGSTAVEDDQGDRDNVVTGLSANDIKASTVRNGIRTLTLEADRGDDADGAGTPGGAGGRRRGRKRSR